MTVEYLKIPTERAGLTTIKCYYKHDGKYAEFYLHVDATKREIRFDFKEPTFEAVLTQAFLQAMQRF